MGREARRVPCCTPINLGNGQGPLSEKNGGVPSLLKETEVSQPPRNFWGKKGYGRRSQDLSLKTTSSFRRGKTTGGKGK